MATFVKVIVYEVWDEDEAKRLLHHHARLLTGLGAGKTHFVKIKAFKDGGAPFQILLYKR